MVRGQLEAIFLMIISFYDAGLNGLQDNASLVVDDSSYKLIKRGVELDSMSCRCEAFTEDIQPTYCVVKDDRGRYVYGCLAGVPQLNDDNQTEVQGSDLKVMLDCDVVMDLSKSHSRLSDYFQAVFAVWLDTTRQRNVELNLTFELSEANISFADAENTLQPVVAEGQARYNVWNELLAPYLKFYGLYMTSSLDLVNKKVVFTIGEAMLNPRAVRLWEYGIKNYGKVTGGISETQCVVYDKTSNATEYGYLWVLNADNTVTAFRGGANYTPTVFPVRRKIIWKETDNFAEEKTKLLNEGNMEALEELAGHMFNENIEISNIEADFSTRFDIYVSRGGSKYKSLPCGELHYDVNGLTKVQIGYRFTGIEFLLR